MTIYLLPNEIGHFETLCEGGSGLPHIIICFFFLYSDIEITKEETIIKEDPGFALRWVSGAIVFLRTS